MATLIRTGNTLTVTLTDDEAGTLQGLEELEDTALAEYLTLWLASKAPMVAHRRLQALSPTDKAAVMATLTKDPLAPTRGRG